MQQNAEGVSCQRNSTNMPSLRPRAKSALKRSNCSLADSLLIDGNDTLNKIALKFPKKQTKAASY